MGSGNYKPLLYPLILIFLIGILIVLITPLFPEHTFESTSSDSSLGNNSVYQFVVAYAGNDSAFYWAHIWTIPVIGFEITFPIFNPFGLLGINEFMATQLIAYTYIPDLISIPLLIILTLSMVYGIIKDLD